MKGKFSSMWRVGLTLVMVLSLGLVTAVPVSAVEGDAALTVTITEPAAGSDIAKDETFTVKAEIKNIGVGGKATDVTATIAITAGTATIVDPLNATKNVADLAVGASEEVTWEVTCGAVGDVTIEVTPAGKDVTTGLAILPAYLTLGSVIIHQVEMVPILAVDITSPEDGGNVSVGNFDVTAMVVNTGFAGATAVQAIIDVSGATASADPGTIELAIGGSAEVVWTVTADTAGPVTIDVTLAGQYGDGETILPENLSSDSIALTAQEPAALEVTGIVAPGTAKVGEEFTVTATVKNTGEATANAVVATIIPGTTEIVETEPVGAAGSTEYTYTLLLPPVKVGSLTVTPEPLTTVIDCETGDLAITYETAPLVAITAAYTGWTSASPPVSVDDATFDLVDLAGDAETQVTFTFLSKALGDAFIKVALTGNDANTEAAITDLTSKSGIIIQKEAAVLEVTSISATPTSVDVGAEFEVAATVTNIGEATAQAVTLTLSINANAVLAEGQVATKTVDYLGPDGTSSETWTLVCTAAGKSKITVSPSGIDVLTGTAIPADSLIAADVTVLQSVTTEPITLSAGWNLISLPLIPTPTESSIETVLAGVDGTVNKVAYYTGGPAGSWLSYSPPAPGNLTTMNDGKGYWIDVSGENPTFTAYGVELALPGESPPTYDVVVGWNLIGFTSTAINVPVESYLGAVMDSVQAMYEYNASTSAYEAVVLLETLTPGDGYWLAVNAAGKIYP